MEDYGFDVARASLLENSGRLPEAAELHLLEGRSLKAIQLFMRDWEERHIEQSRLRAEECVLHGLWQQLSFNVVPPESYENSDLGALLEAADKVRTKSKNRLSKNTEDKVRI